MPDAYWEITKISALKITYRLRMPAVALVLVHWESNDQPCGVTWEPIENIYEDAPGAIFDFIRAHRDAQPNELQSPLL